MAASVKMKQQRDRSCLCQPDFAVVCFFIQKFGDKLGLLPLDIQNLRDSFEADGEATELSRELHVYLLRRLKKNVPADKWERHLSQFCLSYSSLHAWELDQSGYSGLKLSTKLAITRNLLEEQFEGNVRFREQVTAEVPEEDMRMSCYGRDKKGLCYWLLQDDNPTLHVYREEQDDTDGATWQLVAGNRTELADLIDALDSRQKASSRTESPNSDSQDLPDDAGEKEEPGDTLTASLEGSQLAPLNDTDSPKGSDVESKFQDINASPNIKGDFTSELTSIRLHEPLGDTMENLGEKADAEDRSEEPNPNMLPNPDLGIPGMSPASESKLNEVLMTEDGEKEQDATINSAMMYTQDLGVIDSASHTSELQSDGKMHLNIANNLASVESSQDLSYSSEDNIPLSQLQDGWKLEYRTRKALEKAKLHHQKKKLKDKVKRKKLKKQGVTDSPTVSDNRRSSGRSRRPIFNNIVNDSDESSDYPDSEGDFKPKGRNARRQAKKVAHLLPVHDEYHSDVDNDDTPCISCGLYTQPQLILLCDKCDAGWHTACLRPPLFYIPDDDWFCPSCEQAMLIEKLRAHLEALDALLLSKEAKKKRQERQEKYALSNGILMENIIMPESNGATKDNKANREKRKTKLDEYEYDSFEEESYSMPSKRSCRTRNKISYRFDEYDDLIDSAIKDETRGEAAAESCRSLGKDISNLLPSHAPPARVKPSRGKDMSNFGIADSSDEEKVKKKKPGKKKRLNDLDGSGSDVEDEDYAASDDDIEEKDEDDFVEEDSESDDGWTPASRRSTRQRKARQTRRGRSHRREFVPDNDFINDEDEDEQKPKRQTRNSVTAAQAALRRKAKRFGFTSSEEEESTPVSSSAEEEVDVPRIKNKWNSLKTYGGKKATKSSKKTKPKRLRVNYGSDQSTKSESSSEESDDYIPPSLLAKEVVDDNDESIGAEKGNNGDPSEKVGKNVNRIESSSSENETEENKKDMVRESKSGDKTEMQEESTAVLETHSHDTHSSSGIVTCQPENPSSSVAVSSTEQSKEIHQEQTIATPGTSEPTVVPIPSQPLSSPSQPQGVSQQQCAPQAMQFMHQHVTKGLPRESSQSVNIPPQSTCVPQTPSTNPPHPVYTRPMSVRSPYAASSTDQPPHPSLYSNNGPYPPTHYDHYSQYPTQLMAQQPEYSGGYTAPVQTQYDSTRSWPAQAKSYSLALQDFQNTSHQPATYTEPLNPPNFAVDNILHPENHQVQVTGEEDEMSSYLAMASFVTGKSTE